MVKDIINNPFDHLVAKYNGQELWLPYQMHLKDMAGVIDHLVTHWLPAHISELISENNQFIDLQNLCKFIAMVHDIGKATPIFQAKICDRSEYLKERVIASGLDIQPLSAFIDPTKTPHAFAGEAILLKKGCPEGIAAIVGAHHGVPYSDVEDPEDLMEYYEENFYGNKGKSDIQGQKWDTIWEIWIEYALTYSGYRSLNELPDISTPVQMILSGLLMMADWIASNTDYAPLIPLEEKEEAYFYPERIDQIWESLNLPDQWIPCCWFMDDDIFRQKYGFIPNEMQRQMIQVVQDAPAPGIYVLEAQMGLGKTEAALSAAEILASKWHCEGIFFGLPTQATANGIFPRLKDWAEAEGQSEEIRIGIRLAHGMAMLNKGYRELFHGQASQNEDSYAGGLIVHKWFEGRKQALLSSFVIGTVDQLLMAALQQKHVMLRHLGLAGKVVIIDECHAYDTYMSCYLERALEWLGIYKVPVILLSATLPIKRRVRLIEAYLGGKLNDTANGWRENNSYPLLTYTFENDVRQREILVDTPRKKIRIIRKKEKDIPDILKEQLSEGGSAGVIVNTVLQAQEIAKKIRKELSDYEVLLVHARFTMADRQKKEEELLARLGKMSVPETRNLIVIGTQILEQSLDIDFDFLITQVAPMDLLLQRIGRLQRHSNRKRPKRLEEPVCIVCKNDGNDMGSRQIYGDWLLMRTEELMPKNIILPDDISPLVQETYRDMEKDETLYSIWKNHEKNQKIKESKAQSHRLPQKKQLDETIHGILAHDIRDRESDALARVRDGESVICVLIMVDLEDGTAGFVPWQSKGERILMDHMPSEEESRKILLQKVQLPRVLSVYKYEECLMELEKRNLEYLEEWQRAKKLAGELILMLSSALSVELCGFNLNYDEQNGLTYRKEE